MLHCFYLTLFIFDSCYAKKAQIIFVFFNGSDSYQIPYSTGSRTAARVGRYLFCFLLLTFIVKKCGTVYNVIKCNRCSMVKNPTIQKWIPLYIPILLLAFTLPQNPVLFWNVISDIFSGKSNHMKLQVFNFFWPTKIQFHMDKANSYTHVKQLFF